MKKPNEVDINKNKNEILRYRLNNIEYDFNYRLKEILKYPFEYSIAHHRDGTDLPVISLFLERLKENGWFAKELRSSYITILLISDKESDILETETDKKPKPAKKSFVEKCMEYCFGPHHHGY
jgi:hypothetical protein